MPSCNTYYLTWVSLTLDVGYLFTAAPAKRSRCSLPWTKGYLLTAAPPDLEHGTAPLSPPVPARPPLLGLGVAPSGRRPWPRAGVAPLGYSCAVAAWHSRQPHLTSDTGNSSQPPPLGHGVLSASAPDRGRGVALGCALPAPCAPSQPPARCRSPLRAVAAEICDLQ